MPASLFACSVSFLDPASAADTRSSASDESEDKRVESSLFSRPDNSQGRWGAFNNTDGSAAGWGPVEQYGQARWAEDWSWLKDRKRQEDVFDRLKFVRLTPDGTHYVTFSGEERLRGFYDSHPQLGVQRPGRAFRLLLRSVYGADVHLGTHVRLYAEIANGAAGGSNYYGYDGYQRSRLDLQQAFIEIRTQVEGARTGLVIGRQFFIDSPPYVLSVRDLPNIAQSWNGVRGYAVWDRLRLDAFGLLRTDPAPTGIFANEADWHTRLWGAYASYALPNFVVKGRKSRLYLDGFYYGYLYRGSISATSSAYGIQYGATHRDTLGTRLWGTLGACDVSMGGLYQRGVFRPEGGGQRPIRAYALNGRLSYSFDRLFGKPTIGVQADLFSGGDRSRRTIGTYAAPYYNAPFYNDITTYLGPQNKIGVGPVARWKPHKRLIFRLHVPVFWRAAKRDDLYGVTKVYDFRNIRGRFTGTVPQLEMGVSLTRHLTWTHDVAAVIGSHGLHQAGAKDGQFYMQTLDFRF